MNGACINGRWVLYIDPISRISDIPLTKEKREMISRMTDKIKTVSNNMKLMVVDSETTARMGYVCYRYL